MLGEGRTLGFSTVCTDVPTRETTVPNEGALTGVASEGIVEYPVVELTCPKFFDFSEGPEGGTCWRKPWIFHIHQENFSTSTLQLFYVREPTTHPRPLSDLRSRGTPLR